MYGIEALEARSGGGVSSCAPEANVRLLDRSVGRTVEDHVLSVEDVL